jgi:hypothetical protein
MRVKMEISEATRLELVSLLQHLGAKIGASDGGKDDLDREAERHIQAIHDSLKRIVQRGKNDVFASYLLDQLESLATVCVDASTRRAARNRTSVRDGAASDERLRRQEVVSVHLEDVAGPAPIRGRGLAETFRADVVFSHFGRHRNPHAVDHA